MAPNLYAHGHVPPGAPPSRMSLRQTRADYEARRRRAENVRQNPANTPTNATDDDLQSEANTTLSHRGSTEVASAPESASEPRAQRRQSAAVEEQNILDSPDAPRMTRSGSRASAIRTTSTRQERRSSPLKRVEPVRWLELGSSENTSIQARRSDEQVPETPAPVSSDSSTTSESASPEGAHSPVPNETVPTRVTAPAEEDPNSSHDYPFYEEAEAAVNNSLDPIYPVIQRLAARAETDQNVRSLMRALAAGRTSSAQRIEFQVLMMEMDALDPPNVNVNHGKVDEGNSFESDSDDKENRPPASARGCSNNDKPTIERSSSQPRQPLGLLPVPSEDDGRATAQG
ncbi:MAG: hypothetical protein Q9184_005946 [Pyrenodesmia sp. 2 TL-2023]